ncbi:MAG: hypothetical protein J0I12_30580 [Candidatus Eremiobacteraeota bacterium]|nr:hypothetical protein [Candidatus Eremiobacteraeota bacterium]
MGTIAQSLIKFSKDPKQRSLAKHLQSKAWLGEPKGNPVATALAQISDLLGVLKKFPDLEELHHCLDIGRRVYESSLDWKFLGSVLYFDVPDPETHETLGSICLALGEASGMHPERRRILAAMNESRLGFYLPEGRQLRDLWTGALHEVERPYLGESGQLWLVRLVDGALFQKPMVIREANLVLWREFARHHADPVFLKHPVVWDQWLEFGQRGFSEQTEQATFLKVEPETREQVEPGTFSLSQRWSPAVVQEDREAPRRPRLLALADEDSGQILSFDQKMERYSPEEILNWLRAQPEQPRILWLDDSALCAYLSEHWLEGRCQLRSVLPSLDLALKGLALRMESAGSSVTETLSEQEALAFYEEARRFFERAPWQKIGCHEVLIFKWGEAPPWGAVVMGSAEPQEFGLALFDDPEKALAMLDGDPVLPLAGFTLSKEWLVSARDLQFLERHGVTFPGGDYPWLVHQPPESLPFTPELCRRVQWLLTWVPELAESGEPVQRPEGVLARMDLEESDEATLDMLIPLFLGAWGKRSQIAELLAELFCEFLSYLVVEHGISSEQMEDTLEALVPIGDQYLRLHGRKRNLVLEFFLDPGQDKLRLRLAKFLQERIEE